MIVVADTSPMNYLVLIGQVEILPVLYSRVLLPEAVERELSHRRTSAIVRAWIQSPPDWLEIRSVPIGTVLALDSLDSGEAEAILLAEAVLADQVMIDESAGRQVAESRGLKVIGTLGVLREAALRNLIDLPSTIARLRQTNFRASSQIFEDILRT